MSKVKWLSKMKARWFVARHGSKFVYVELKGTVKNATPLIIRTIKVISKGGKIESIYTEFYDLDSMKEIVDAELQLISLLSAINDEEDLTEALISRIGFELSHLANKLDLVRSLFDELKEVIPHGKGKSGK